MRHTVILSDIHLWEAVTGDDLWMRYRQRRFFPDEAFAALVARLTADVSDGDFELVLNGDIFDFDVPRPDGRDDTPHVEADAARRVDRILDDHPAFVDALAGLLARNHRVVFVSGNHDVQLVFPSVRARIVARLDEAAARRAGLREVGRRAVVSARGAVIFRAWFHRTRDGVHVEHGHQYDPYCATRYPQAPFAPGTATLQPTLSSLSMRHLAGRFGYFNPNADGTFILTLPGYLSHWARYYLFSRRSLVLAWLVGTLRVVAGLLRAQPREEVERALGNLLRTARETGASLEALSAHGALFARQEFLRAARILWFDKLVLVASLAAVALATLAHRPTGVVLGALVACAALVASRVMPDGDLERVYVGLLERQREIASIHGARAVVFGHTHIARGSWVDGVFVGNSGTWAPMFHDIACTRPVQRGFPFVWLRTTEGGEVHGGLYRVIDGAVTPDGDSVREAIHHDDHEERDERSVAA